MHLSEHYIYAHYVDNKPVYIGKGKGNRHLDKRSYDDHTSSILLGSLTEDKALDLEEWLIKLIGLDNLRNKYPKGTPGRGYTDIYKVAKHRNVERIFDRAENGDIEAIQFIAKYIPEQLNKAIQNNNLHGFNK
tara:strand:+ start:71 stop:469 length:399 start_codon:yes stop_codon:yes gene_type:complete